MKTTELLFDVPYSKEEAIKVLEYNIDQPKMLHMSPKINHKCSLIGKIEGDLFIFREQSMWGYSGLYDRNNLHPYFEGYIVATGECCQICGKFTNGPIGDVLGPIILSLMAILCGVTSFAIIYDWIFFAEESAAVVLFFTLPVLSLSIYGLFFSKPARKRDVEKYKEIFERLLNAKLNETN